MEVVKLDDIIRNEKTRKRIVEAMITGKIFIYPTDTIYGIGCNAMDSDVVRRIRELKRSYQPFSVIAPSKGWVNEKLFVKHPGFLKRLPGPYTFVFKKRNPDFLVAVSDSDSLGIRIPKHPFSELVYESGVPFVTTSVNISGGEFVTKPEEIPDEIKNTTDFLIDVGVLDNPPSKVIDLTSEEPKVIRE
ncbi:MAG: threonylcarbamoyl-AMP synthase [Candidatus Aenigmatarchaeota archaeon]|nr:MAG: threonylcarbamoyl-AMP synthase [Candidatus Aenigmarchaeota archaeon]